MMQLINIYVDRNNTLFLVYMNQVQILIIKSICVCSFTN